MRSKRGYCDVCKRKGPVVWSPGTVPKPYCKRCGALVPLENLSGSQNAAGMGAGLFLAKSSGDSSGAGG